jgi:hypothetical protein
VSRGHEVAAAGDDAFGIDEPPLEATAAAAGTDRVAGGEGLGVEFELFDGEEGAAQGGL